MVLQNVNLFSYLQVQENIKFKKFKKKKKKNLFRRLVV